MATQTFTDPTTFTIEVSTSSGGSVPPEVISVAVNSAPPSVRVGGQLSVTLTWSAGGSGSASSTITGVVNMNGAEVGTFGTQSVSATGTDSGYVTLYLNGAVPSGWGGQTLQCVFTSSSSGNTATAYVPVEQPSSPPSFSLNITGGGVQSYGTGYSGQLSVTVTNVGGSGYMGGVTGTSTATDGTTATWSSAAQDDGTYAAGQADSIPVQSNGPIAAGGGVTVTITLTSPTGQTAGWSLYTP